MNQKRDVILDSSVIEAPLLTAATTPAVASPTKNETQNWNQYRRVPCGQQSSAKYFLHQNVRLGGLENQNFLQLYILCPKNVPLK